MKTRKDVINDILTSISMTEEVSNVVIYMRSKNLPISDYIMNMSSSTKQNHIDEANMTYDYDITLEEIEKYLVLV